MQSRSLLRHVRFGVMLGVIAAGFMSAQARAGNTHEQPSADPSAVSTSGAAALSGSASLAGAASLSGSQSGVQSDIGVDTSLVGGDSSARARSGDSNASADGTQTTLVDASSVYERSVGTLIMGTVIPVDCGFGGQAGGANTNASGFLGASWTTDRCYTLKVANAWAAMGEYEYACEMLMDVSRRAMKRRGIVNVDCAVIGARLRGWHAMPAPVVTKSEAVQPAPPAGSSNYVTQEQLDRAFKKSLSK